MVRLHIEVMQRNLEFNQLVPLLLGPSKMEWSTVENNA